MAESGADADGETTQAQWRARLQRFAQAGCSVAQFCAAEGVSGWSFYRWRRKLGGDVPRRLPAVAAARGKASAMPPGGFVDAGVARVGGAEVGAPLELRLDLGGGVVLQVLRR